MKKKNIRYPTIKTSTNISIVKDGKTYMANSSNPNWNLIEKSFEEEDWDELFKLLGIRPDYYDRFFELDID